MESRKALKAVVRESLLCFSFMLLFCGQVIFSATESSASESICAKVLEVEGVVQSKTSGEKIGSLRPGQSLKIGEELNIKAKSWIVLMMADSTVRKFNGPATITMKEDFGEADGSVLSRLGSAIVGLLFAREKESSEAVMATRRFVDRAEVSEITKKSYLPLLIHPAPGSSILKRPSGFEWQKVEGIPLYRVSVYSWDRLLWQATTSNSSIGCPREHCDLEPGETYYWVVEGLIGNSTLRSKPAKFKVLPEEIGSELQEALSDPDLSVLAKVRLCLSLNLYDQALKLVDSHWGPAPSDPEAYRLRAEIKGMMGLLEDAFLDYKSASSMPSVK